MPTLEPCDGHHMRSLALVVCRVSRSRSLSVVWILKLNLGF